MTAVVVPGPRPARPRTRILLPVVPAVLLVLLAITGPLLAAHPVDKPVTAPYGTAGTDTALGGDQLGRDVLSRLLHGGSALIGSALIVAAVVTLLATLLGCFAVLGPRLGRLVERAADTAILLPPVLGIMLLALAWPGGGRLAISVAAIALGTPYAVRIVASAAAPWPPADSSKRPPRAASASGIWPCGRSCPTSVPPSWPCSACASSTPSMSSPWPASSSSAPNRPKPTGH